MESTIMHPSSIDSPPSKKSISEKSTITILSEMESILDAYIVSEDLHQDSLKKRNRKLKNKMSKRLKVLKDREIENIGKLERERQILEEKENALQVQLVEVEKFYINAAQNIRNILQRQ